MNDEVAVIWHRRNASTSAYEAYIAIIDGRVCIVEKEGYAWDIKLDGKHIKITLSKETILDAVEDYLRDKGDKE